MKALHEDNLKHIKIPVMAYHRVVDKIEVSRFGTSITQAKLESQIKSFLDNGYQLVTFKDLKGKDIKKPMVLTFDDGYLDNYQNLFPLLKKYNVKAVIFVLADSQYNHWDVDAGEMRIELMNHKQMAELSKSGLVEIASHGLTHQRLTNLSDDEVKKELVQSKQKLEEIIDDKVISFAYPWGMYTEREKQFVKDAGYEFGVAVNDGCTFFYNDLFAIKRISMYGESLWQRVIRRLKWALFN